MKTIAFKRAKQNQNSEGSLHPEFITEYIDYDLIPENISKEDYETLPEDEFQAELSQNQAKHEQFLADKRAAELLAQTEAEANPVQDDLQAEFEQFLAWKRSQENN